MKYIEELKPGDIFVWQTKKYVLSADYKNYQNTHKYMSVSIDDGLCRWFTANDIVEILPIFYRDQEGNILLVKEYTNDSTENTHIS